VGERISISCKLNQNPNELNWIIDFERSIRMRAWPLGRYRIKVK
jgi:hypothetical protein